jgi:hypothetical protein
MTVSPFLNSYSLVFLSLTIASVGCKPAVDVGGETKTIDVSKVCSGTTLFGVAGTATCYSTSNILQSNASRNLGTTQLTLAQEVSTYAGSVGAPPASNLPSNYREITDQTKDNEGSNAVGANQYGTRPQVACGGTAILTITNKIADCVSKNGSNATWDGSVKGTAGQSIWKLVFSSGQAVAGTCSIAAMSTDCYEVWQDQRTGLLWSSSLFRVSSTTGINHCLASGNSQNVDTDCSVGGSYQYATTPGSACSESAETGGVQALVGICSNATGTLISSGLCTGAGGTWYNNTLTPTGGQEDYSTGNYSIAKGYMGAKSNTQVRWRLPTRYDFELADVDGIRFVMPDLGRQGGAGGRASDGTPGTAVLALGQWTSTIRSDSRSSAWIASATLIAVTTADRSTRGSVRCIGR